MSRSYASTYFARVRATMSSGNGGGASPEDFDQPDAGDVSQSRTYCLSKLGCGCPGSHWSAGQKRDESGVRT